MVSDALLAKSAIKAPSHQNTFQDGGSGASVPAASTPRLSLVKEKEVPKELTAAAENNKTNPVTVVINGLPTTGNYQLSASGSIHRYHSVEKLQQSQSQAEESKESKRAARRQNRENRFDRFLNRSEDRYGESLSEGFGSMRFLSSYLWLSMMSFSYLMPTFSLLSMSFALERYRRYRRAMRDLFDDYSPRSRSPHPRDFLGNKKRVESSNAETKASSKKANSTLKSEKWVSIESSTFQLQIKAEQPKSTSEVAPEKASAETLSLSPSDSVKPPSDPPVESRSLKPYD